MKSRLFIFFLAFFLPACSVFADTIGISVHSELKDVSTFFCRQCILRSLEHVKGKAFKELPDLGSFSNLKAAKVCIVEDVDVLYHIHFMEEEGKAKAKCTQYDASLKQIAGIDSRPVDKSERPCDLSSLMILDLLDKHPALRERARPFLYKARQLAQLKRFDEAGTLFQQAAQALPSTGSVYREMGYYLESAGRYDWAIEWYKTAIKMDDNEVPSFLRIAEIELVRGSPEAATGFLAQAIDRNAKPPVVFAMLGNLYEALELYELAWTTYRNAYWRDPNNEKTLLGLVRTLKMDGKFSEAAEILKKYLKRHPEDPVSRSLLLELYLKAENYNAAISMLRLFLRTYPNEEVWLGQLGKALVGIKDFDGATKEFEKLLKINPESSQAKFELAKIAYRRKDFDTAEKYLNGVLANNEMDIEAMSILGRMKEIQENYIEAIEIQKKILLYSYPIKDGDLLRLFALARKAGAMALAENAVQDMIPFKNNKDRRMLTMSLAETLVADGRAGEATQLLESQMSFLDRHAPAYLLLGKLLISQGREEEANDVFKKGMMYTSDPSFPLTVGVFYMKRNRFEEAQFFFQFGVNRDEKNLKLRMFHLETALLNGDIDSAHWTIHILQDFDLPPLYQQYLSFLQFVFAKLKGETEYAKSALNYGMEIIKKYGSKKRLDFQDFVGLVEKRFDGSEKQFMLDTIALFEGKISLNEYKEKNKL